MAEEWLEPWYRLADERQRCLLEEELKRELAEGHPLAGLAVKVVARRDDQDDVLVALDNDNGENGRVAEVHLTWSGKREADPRWPLTVIFESMDEWQRQSKDCEQQ
jgi:hypothetical protein